MGLEIRIVDTSRGIEAGFTVQRVEDGEVTGYTQQWATREEAEACLHSPRYTWLHHSDRVCDHKCERFCWDAEHEPVRTPAFVARHGTSPEVWR